MHNEPTLNKINVLSFPPPLAGAPRRRRRNACLSRRCARFCRRCVRCRLSIQLSKDVLQFLLQRNLKGFMLDYDGKG